jgi:DASH complex subunit DAD2
MSYRTTNYSSQLRQQSQGSSTQSSALQHRINEKRVELENLKQLRDLSAGLAGQMEQLEEKLSTLSDGTEGVFLKGLRLPDC